MPGNAVGVSGERLFAVQSKRLHSSHVCGAGVGTAMHRVDLEPVEGTFRRRPIRTEGEEEEEEEEEDGGCTLNRRTELGKQKVRGKGLNFDPLQHISHTTTSSISIGFSTPVLQCFVGLR